MYYHPAHSKLLYQLCYPSPQNHVHTKDYPVSYKGGNGSINTLTVATLTAVSLLLFQFPWPLKPSITETLEHARCK